MFRETIAQGALSAASWRSRNPLAGRDFGSVVQRAGLDPRIEHTDLVIGEGHPRSQFPRGRPLGLRFAADRRVDELAVHDALRGIARDHARSLLVAGVTGFWSLLDQIAPSPGLVCRKQVQAATKVIACAAIAAVIAAPWGDDS